MNIETPTYQCIALAPGNGVAPPSTNLRNDMLQWTPAERAIHDAVQAVEVAGANPLLTDAVNLLAHARQKVAMWVETGAAGACAAPGQPSALPSLRDEIYRMADAAKAEAARLTNEKQPGAEKAKGRALGIRVAADMLDDWLTAGAESTKAGVKKS